jgi:hypothetical protein
LLACSFGTAFLCTIYPFVIQNPIRLQSRPEVVSHWYDHLVLTCYFWRRRIAWNILVCIISRHCWSHCSVFHDFNLNNKSFCIKTNLNSNFNLINI